MPVSYEQFINGFGDTKLFVQRWPATKSAGTLLITHGQGEHSGSYDRLIEALRPLQLDIFGWDLRGHGKSEGLRGYAQSFDDYCKDYELVFRFIEENRPRQKPLFLLAHSMGATIQLKALIDQPHVDAKAQILCSPLLGLSLAVPIVKDLGAQVLKLALPQLTLWNEIYDEQLTRDPEVIAEFMKDSLRHHRISPSVYLGFLEAIEYIKRKSSRIYLPTLCQIPERDDVVSSEATRSIFESLSKASHSLLIYKNRKHELYNDLDREEVFEDLRIFLRSHIAQESK